MGSKRTKPIYLRRQINREKKQEMILVVGQLINNK